MPSTLSGLVRTLAWTDFPRRRAQPPGPGQHATAAYTHSTYSTSGISIQPIAGSQPTQYRLADSLTVTVTFSGSKSYVMSWLFNESTQFQNDMLNHEQGHYNITALVSRDFFVDVMQLKQQTFTTAQDGLAAVTQIQQQSLDKIANIHTLYDQEVHPEQTSGFSRGPVQQRWDRYMQTAFTQARTTGTTAPDGTTHKIRLIDVLTADGKQI